MVSLIAHLVIGIALIAWLVAANRPVFARPVGGPMFSAVEIAFYALGIASVLLGYYFNHQFVAQYAVPGGNPFWGPGSWQEFIQLGYTNPAASNASQDYTIINVLLLPLFTIVDGRRRGLRHPWLFFAISLFTSCALAYALYFAVIERQHRHAKAALAQAAPQPA